MSLGKVDMGKVEAVLNKLGGSTGVNILMTGLRKGELAITGTKSIKIKMKYPDVTLGEIGDVWGAFGGYSGIDSYLKSEVAIVNLPKLYEVEKREDGTIHFFVTSDGTTKEQWIARFKLSTESRAGEIIGSLCLVPTTGKSIEVVIIPGEMIKRLRPGDVMVKARNLGLERPNLEEIFLTLENLSVKSLGAMGFNNGLIAMHKPYRTSAPPLGLFTPYNENDTLYRRLCINIDHSGKLLYLSEDRCQRDEEWNGSSIGFIFIKPANSPVINSGNSKLVPNGVTKFFHDVLKRVLS